MPLSRAERQTGGWEWEALTNEAMVGGEQVLLPQGRTHNSACACPHTELMTTEHNDITVLSVPSFDPHIPLKVGVSMHKSQ